MNIQVYSTNPTRDDHILISPDPACQTDSQLWEPLKGMVRGHTADVRFLVTKRGAKVEPCVIIASKATIERVLALLRPSMSL